MLGVLFALLLAWATPASAWADELTVGDGQTYQMLDDAVATAKDGDVIVLYGDATTNGLNLSKNLTIQGASGLSEKPTVTFTQYGIALWGKSLTFKDCDVQMNGIGSTPYTGEWNWMSICASVDASMTLDNVEMTMDATGTTNGPHAIYFCSNNVLNLKNGTTLTIKNYVNDAFEWDGGDGGYNVNITDSTFVSDHNRSGFTGTFIATITNSKVDVINSIGNGSNGSHFDIKDSKVNFSDNGSHGLSAGWLTIDNSTVDAKNNHGMGVTVNQALTVENGSVVTVEGNADNSSYGYAAVRLYNNYASSVDSTSKLYVKDNNSTGIYVRQGSFDVADGAVLEVTGNKVSHTLLDGYGGGIYVGYGDNYDPTVKLPADAKIYNNHSLNGGDDIYVSEGVNGPSLTFGQTGSGWALDGDPDCTDAIDGWYYDGMDEKEGAFVLDTAKRWEAHADSYGGIYAKSYGVDGTKTVTGPLALKAAHGLGTVSVDPADITIYMGGTSGYSGVSSDNGRIVGSNSLPEPGFYIELPDDVNAALQAAGATTDGESADLSSYLSIYTYGYGGESGELHWKLEPYGNTYSGANGHHIYRIVPDPTEGQEAVPVRLQFTGADGKVYTSDNFDPSATGALNQHYTMQLYTELVDNNQVVFEVTVDNEHYYNTMALETGDLNIRYVTGDQADVVTDVLNSADALASAKAENPDKAFAVLSDDTTYYINNGQVDVTDSAAPSLLFDNVVSDHTTEGASDYDQQLANRAVDVIANAGTTYTNPWYEAKYLDLVDANNGNVWLKSSNSVTVYWPYPAGTDENTQFQLVHFEGLNREMANSEVSGNISSANAYTVDVENTPYGIKFTTDGFSPFVLMWEGKGEQPAPEDTKKPSKPATGSLAQTGDNTLTIIAGVGAAGVACLGAAFAIKKRSE